ncbi:hypothetical protein KSC_018590 [Ktedonobacter sp. SOSP1-52]|nr:hypothetical protein KSC_018590 [Ktedonobacter sp. SOSP1-52]
MLALICQSVRTFLILFLPPSKTRWKEGLAHRPDVTIRIYEADNHLFFPGTGPSTPAEYDLAQHVDPAVVADIATWLRPHPGMLARFVSRVLRFKR